MSEQVADESLAALLDECEEVLEYRFRDRQLLHTCLTHASVARTRLASNERLEFLGDSVLGFVVCETLFHQFPTSTEGDLTRMKSVLVSRDTCAAIAEELGLDRFVLLGKGLTSHDSVPSSIMAAVFESLIAGVYLDGGYERARELVIRLLADGFEQVAQAGHERNFKSQLQQLAQKQFGATPVYRLLDEKGPDHSKCFKVAAVIGDASYAAAWGASKKQAEQRAAHNALAEIEGRKVPYVAD